MQDSGTLRTLAVVKTLTADATLVVDDSHRVIVALPASVPVGTRVRVSVTAAEPDAGESAPEESDPVLDIVGAYAGEPGPTGRRAEEILYGREQPAGGTSPSRP